MGPIFKLMSIAAAAALLVLGGCMDVKAPRLPQNMTDPVVEISRVDLRDAGVDAARYDVILILTNPNDFPLPLTRADYTVTVDGGSYAGDTIPNATLPASGQISVKLPAIIAQPPGDSYQVNGSIEMIGPGQFRSLIYEVGVPKPRISFSGTGSISPLGGAAAAGESE